jgi:hypothetical protein
MLLKVLDRVTLLSTLPEQGDYITLKIVRKLRESLAFEEYEIKDLKIQQANGQITWDAAADDGKEIEIGEKATDIIVDLLKKLDKEKKLTSKHFGLYETFVDRGC